MIKSRSMLGAVAALGLAAFALPHQAQTADTADAWKALAKLPDWSGLWEITRGGAFLSSEPALTADYAAHAEAYEAAEARGEIQDTPAANCVPPGMPVIMWEPYPIEFLFTPGKVTIMIEAYSQWRQIFTDGRPLPKDPDPWFNGHSIGHWEGDTLVVETNGVSTDTPLGRNYGARHSDKLRIVERMRLTEPDLLQIETTITDPDALREPWTTTRVYARHSDWNLTEYICQQNNRNYTTASGKAGIDLKQ
jgi:hypothetical protein